MNQEELQNAVTLGVKTALRDLGIDSEEWKEVRKDMHWVRVNRTRCESFANRAVAWVIMFVIGGGALAAWQDALASVMKGIGK